MVTRNTFHLLRNILILILQNGSRLGFSTSSTLRKVYILTDDSFLAIG